VNTRSLLAATELNRSESLYTSDETDKTHSIQADLEAYWLRLFQTSLAANHSTDIVDDAKMIWFR
jgi:hypothetical protein